MSVLFGSGTKTQKPVPATSINIQTAVAGLPIPIILGGMARVPGNLIGYTDFKATGVSASSGGGGKGSLIGGSSSGGKGGGAAMSYTYSVAVEIALGEGGLQAVGAVWNNKTKQTPDTLNLSTFTGSATQTAWGYLSSLHPDQALPYRGLAYMAAGPLQLGSSTELPNLSFEVTSTNSYAVLGIPDADFSTCLTRLLTDPNFGVGFGVSRIGDLSVYTSYCRAAGMLGSPVVSDLTNGQDVIKTWLEATNSEAVWSQGQLRIVPRGDQALNANGSIYTPPVQPLYALGDDDYVTGSNGASQPVDITRSAPQDQKNSVIVNYLDRSNDYASTPTPAAKDDAAIQMYGLRQDSVRDYPFFCTAQAAQQSAQLLLGRQLVRNTYTFTLGQKYIGLDPMDLVSLTDSAAGLVNKWVRITEIQENDDLTLTMTAEEYLAGSSAAPTYGHEPNAGYTPNYNEDPGFINAPLIFEPPSTLTGGTNELWVAVSGSNPAWGGCDTYVSYDDTTYGIVPDAHLVGAARQGFLTAALPIGSALDTANTLAIDISQVPGAQLTSGTMVDATNLATLCYVDGEMIAYESASLTALGRYNLTGLVRGAYGTPIAAHAAGKPFARLDTQIIKIPFNRSLVGSAIFLKFVSFNSRGQGGQSIADVSPIEYTFGGGQPPGLIIFTSTAMAQSGLAASLVAAWSADALSAAYQVQVSQDQGASWSAVYDGGDTKVRLDGLKAVQTLLRARGVTSSGVVGVWASAVLQPPTLTSAGIGYSNFLSYKDLDPVLVDTALSHDLEADLNDLAGFVSAVSVNAKTASASQQAASAAAAAVQIASGAVPSLAVTFAGQTAGLLQQIGALTQTVLQNAAQEVADVTNINKTVTSLTASVSNVTAALNTNTAVTQANINASTALQSDAVAAGSALDNDLGELAQFVAQVQAGTVSAVQGQASKAAQAVVANQAYANSTAIQGVALSQMALAATIAGSLAQINNTLLVQATAATSLASRTTKIESAIGDPITGLSATYNQVVATSATVNDPAAGNNALSTKLTTQAASIAGNASAINSLSNTSATQAQTIGSLQTTVQSNYNALSSNIASNGTAITTLSNQYGSLSQAIQTASAQSAAGTANGQIAFVTQSAPSGVTARFAVQLSVTGQQPATGGFSLDLVNGQVGMTVAVSSFRIENAATRTVPFGVDASGAVILQGITYIGSVINSQSVFPNGERPMVIDFVNGSITIYDGQ